LTNRIKIAIDLDRVLASYITAILPSIGPYPKASWAITELSKKYDLVVITARHPLFKKTTTKWINKFFAHKFNDILFLNYKTIFGPRSLKSDLCLENNVKIILDDKPRNILDCQKNGIKSYQFVKYTVASSNKNIKKLSNWSAVIEELM
jgi:5'(3')-deoxyribonucleotidase